MKTQREEALAHQNDTVSSAVLSNTLANDEELKVHQFTPSLFGPCCTEGCQYCRPNCHEQNDSSNFF
ncbi:hypothetical protein [Desulfosporosinus hippei]|uniref:Uncharacterized protein n=1 Tax=Desulfosporosinus hippei DSM 8344 TaxID=1121419 RepID=A0A1G8EP70_9FIRM|nr:hypothetical protein [Desulfosporosinus hippei]SDH71716.1 hypothetical protein SAMN05443529_11790 [Desulfosporosinus hippei DSM 8344]